MFCGAWFGLLAELLDGLAGRRQVVQILGLDLGQEQVALDVRREAFELFLDLGDGLQVLALLLPGPRHGVEGMRVGRLRASVVEGGEGAGDEVGDVPAPDDGQRQAAHGRQGNAHEGGVRAHVGHHRHDVEHQEAHHRKRPEPLHEHELGFLGLLDGPDDEEDHQPAKQAERNDSVEEAGVIHGLLAVRLNL